MKALVIGYGSPIRGDDAIGPLAADRLAEEGVPDGVAVVSRHILTAELVPDIASAERVVFLDAELGETPGQVICRRLEPDASAMSTMAHFHDPKELLAWSQALYDSTPEAWLVTVTGAEFGYSSYELTEAAAAAVGPMIDRVRGLLAGEKTTSQAS